MRLAPEQIDPYADRVLVRPDPLPEMSAGGLHLPASAVAYNHDWFPISGTVIRVGRRVVEPFEPGERVSFQRYGGAELDLCGERHFLMLEADILGRLTDGSIVSLVPQGLASRLKTDRIVKAVGEL